MEEKNTNQKTSESKNFDFHKVFAAIGIILVVTIVLLSVLLYFIGPDFFDSGEVNVSTKSAKIATQSTKEFASKSATKSVRINQ